MQFGSWIFANVLAKLGAMFVCCLTFKGFKREVKNKLAGNSLRSNDYKKYMDIDQTSEN
jgi:hypothetical protein